MDPTEVAALRERAAEAVGRASWAEALRSFLELESVDPNPDWPRRSAAVFAKLSKPKEEKAALDRAAYEYARRGDILKAVAMCRQVLAMDPTYAPTLKRMTELRKAWDASRPAAAAQQPVAGASARQPVPRPATGTGLDQVPLRD